MGNQEIQTIQNVLQVEGVNARGFGMLPKLVMRDRRLSAYSKAIYAYFCSYAGAGTTAFPSVSLILADLGLAKDTYYKHLDLLKQYGYLGVRQQKADACNRFARNVYTLLTHPTPATAPPETTENTNKRRRSVPMATAQSRDVAPAHRAASAPVAQNTDAPADTAQAPVRTARPQKVVAKQRHTKSMQACAAEPCPKIWDTGNCAPEPEPCPNSSDTEKQDTKKNSLKKNSIDLSINMLDTLKALAQEVLASDAPVVKITARNVCKAAQVKQRFLQLTEQHFQYVADCVARVETEIFSLRSYLLAALYNAPLTLERYLRSSFSGRDTSDAPPERTRGKELLGMHRAPVFALAAGGAPCPL